MNLNISNLSKTYPNGLQAIKDVSLNIENGMFGLLGPNGAGKSTLMRILTTLQEADSGTIMLNDINVLKEKNEVKKVLGYLPQEFGFYPKENAYTLLDHFTLLRGFTDKSERRARVEELLKKVNLWNDRKTRLFEFSGGMKQRFGIAIALLGNPNLIIVDEPTAGLDPAERNRFHNLLSEIGENVIVILSTHIVDDVSDLCENMAIINEGRIVLKDKTQQAIDNLNTKIWEKQILKSDLAEYQDKFKVLSTRLFAGKTFIRIFSHQNPANGFVLAEANLEDVYFHSLNHFPMEN